jgi:hypothetical protein
MASGSSYTDPPTEPPLPYVPPNTHIPKRATRILPDQPHARFASDEPETRVVEEFHSPRRTAPTKRPLALLEPPFEEKSPRFSAGKPHPLTRHRAWMPRFLLIMVCVVIGVFVVALAGMYQRQQGSQVYNGYQQGQSFPIQLGGSYQAFNTWNNSTGPIPSQTPLPNHPGPYSVLGKPTISVAQINAILAHYHSPTAGMGQSLYDLGVQYGIDPVYALAFFMHESLFGTTGEARVTLSLGNERCIPDRACIDQDRGGYARMNSWQDGFEHWYKLIRNLYVAQWGRVTVDQIIPRYAPNSDGNDEAEYIASLKHEVDVWRAGGITP